MPRRHLTLRALAVAGSLVLPATAAVASTGGAAATPTRCYSQLSLDTGVSNVSDKYEPVFHAYDNRAADDFVLTKPCRVRSIDVIGTFYDGIGPAESEQVRLSYDNGGTPGATIASQRVIGTYVFGGGSFHLVLHRPIRLPLGTYWLSVRANVIFEQSGQWGWNSIDHRVGALPVWKNPLDGYQTGCTTYQPLHVCLGQDPDFSLGLGFAINSTAS
jgi:hypothetical protein